MRIFENLNVDFLGKRKIAYAISGTLLVLGIISLLLRGLELGIDFKGGSEIALQFEKQVDISAVRNQLNTIGLGNVEVKTFGGESGVLVRTELQEIPADLFPNVIRAIQTNIDKHMPGLERSIIDSTRNSVTFQFANVDTTEQLIEALFIDGFQTGHGTTEAENTTMVVRVGISDWIKENLKESMPDNHFSVLKEDIVGPKIGNELKRDAIIAVVLALLGILIYLGFRFKFAFAVGAVAALFHDVMITLGLFSLLYGLFDFLNLEISINVVAAFLTLVGYSINDTVIVFDRVRENFKIHKTAPIEDNINKAINKTMPRTIITSLTTLMVTFVLLIFGGEVLRGFAFTLFFGVLIGTYSSVFVASAFVLEYATKRKTKIQF
ncbi:MAG: protein translocase subunit SecF [Melioribacteraceae bacterium]|nr:protein translocase subunit SecF [Melioribacteraceae bacterium]MCF8355332.1 protein translocase subunit SecF [Melioribacteraceae bacterium]MCF8392354.1 protein translocase subunit SecF [Melioribacteraceae bacterium]MCF8417874.1 protein translocase subunit SecF [Melioribacteraceae bacterium]